ncbi:MAG: amino acid permease [Deltaproteobacteria bacterium]|nr:MAG: amino acid permease [Deltaproteobacteria bacterium]
MPADAALRRVGAFTAACVLVSNAVGSGIFTTTGFLSRDLGDPRLILLLWGLGGVLALAGAMSYSELGAALPRVGGEYVYLRRTFGPLCGFMSGWTSFTIGFSAAIAAAAVSFGHYLLELVPEGAPRPAPAALALLLVWILTGIHALGVERGGSFQRFITVLKIGGIGLLVAAGFAFGQGRWANVATASAVVEPGLGAGAVGLIFVLYSFSGWNAAGYIAGEIREPGRNLPRAMVGGTLFISALYLAVNLVYFYALPVDALAREPVLPVAEKAAAALFGTTAAQVVVGVLCVSIAGAISSMIWAGPRVYWAMAEDGVAPALLGRTSRSHAPVHAIALQSLWITVLIVSGTFEQLVVYSGVALALFSALAVGSVIALRRREPDLPRPYRVAFYPWLPLLYIAASLLIAGYATLERPRESLLSIATVLVGIPFYLFWSRRRPARPRSVVP